MKPQIIDNDAAKRKKNNDVAFYTVNDFVYQVTPDNVDHMMVQFKEHLIAMAPKTLEQRREANSGCFVWKRPAARIYLSGKYEDWERAASYIMELERELGCVMTHNWTTEKARQLGATDAAVCDIDGVRQCDILLVVLEDSQHPYRGTFCELGVALGLQKPVILCNLAGGDDPRLTPMAHIFTTHPSIIAKTACWADAKQALREWLEDESNNKVTK